MVERGRWAAELEAMSWPDSPKCTNHNIIVYFSSNVFSQDACKNDHFVSFLTGALCANIGQAATSVTFHFHSSMQLRAT